MTKYLIVANGPAPTEASLKVLTKDRKILALDGAADQLQKLNIKPDILLGDFDSLQNIERWGIQPDAQQEYFNAQNILIVPAYDQRYTDLQKAIAYCDAHGASQIDVVAATDGRFDHTLSNLNLLRSRYKKNRPLILHTQTQSLVYLANESYQVHGEVGEYVGLFGFLQGSVTSQGLKYELSDYLLTFSEVDGSSNSLAKNSALIEVSGEILLIMPLIFGKI